MNAIIAHGLATKRPQHRTTSSLESEQSRWGIRCSIALGSECWSTTTSVERCRRWDDGGKNEVVVEHESMMTPPRFLPLEWLKKQYYYLQSLSISVVDRYGGCHDVSACHGVYCFVLASPWFECQKRGWDSTSSTYRLLDVAHREGATFQI